MMFRLFETVAIHNNIAFEGTEGVLTGINIRHNIVDFKFKITKINGSPTLFRPGETIDVSTRFLRKIES
jgi:hypothetical protein